MSDVIHCAKIEALPIHFEVKRMSRTSTYYYVILKLANPTGEALQNGLKADDLLEAADVYNARFKRLKQLLILKTDGIKIHAILTLAALSGVVLKRTHSDFSTHIAMFNNYLLNQKQWTNYSQDYRRLIQFASEPQVCTEEEVLGIIDALGYDADLADQATVNMKFVGPSDQTALKWLLHVRQCLQYPPHMELSAEHSEMVTASAPISQQPTSLEAAPTPAPAQEEEPAVVKKMTKRTLTYTPPATILRNTYGQGQGSQTPKKPTAEQSFADVLEQHDEPLEALRQQSLKEYQNQASLHVQSEEVAVDDAAAEFLADLQHLIEEPEIIEQPEATYSEADESLEIIQSPDAEAYSPLNDEQLMAVLHSMVLTQNIGDEQAIVHKKQTIEQIKQLIAPWATFG
jgi:arsenate reductase-like glutaredoxin family protein